MRSAALLITAICTAASAQTPAARAARSRVAGRAINANTGAPLKKVTVWLKPSAAGGVNEGHTVAVRSTTSDAQGRFSFDAVDAGAYVLSGRRSGYLEQGYGARSPLISGPPFKVDAGQDLTDVVLKLAPQGIIFGKVTDEDGDPMPGVQVQAARLDPAGRRSTREISEVSTPGRWQLCDRQSGARPVPASCAARSGRRGRCSGAAGFVCAHFFPGSADPAAAAPVEIGAGAEVRGQNIRLARIPVYRIRGRVVDSATGEPAGNTSLRLVRAGDEVAPARGVTVGATASFNSAACFRATTGSSHQRHLCHRDRPRKPARRCGTAGRLVGRIRVHIGQEDLDNLVVPLGERSRSARLVPRGGSGKQFPAGLQLELMPADGDIGNAVIAPVGRDGAFHFSGVMPEHYTVSVGGLQDGFYVRSIRSGNQDLTHLPLDLTPPDPAALEIALSPDGAEVRGVVRGPAGDDRSRGRGPRLGRGLHRLPGDRR